MTWRGSSTPADRIFASLVYLLPLLDVIVLCASQVGSGSFLSPIFRAIAIPLAPLLSFYYGFGGFMPLIIFFALFLLVVRNEKIAHFIRFNAMQSILFGIVLSLISILWRYVLAGILGGSLLEQTLFNTIFLGTIVAVGYSVVQSALGRYAEIPTISEAAYTQVR
ncbi:MAG TPA: Tic20 family protein [Thermosynechococcaceae cyanobacterium]